MYYYIDIAKIFNHLGKRLIALGIIIKGVIIMSLVLKCAAVGGFLYYLEIRRPEVYLKKSKRARIWMELTKWAIIIGFFVLVFAAEQFFIDNLMTF